MSFFFSTLLPQLLIMILLGAHLYTNWRTARLWRKVIRSNARNNIKLKQTSVIYQAAGASFAEATQAFNQMCFDLGKTAAINQRAAEMIREDVKRASNEVRRAHDAGEEWKHDEGD